MSAREVKVPEIIWEWVDERRTEAARFGEGFLLRTTAYGIDGAPAGVAMVYVPDAQAFPDVVFGKEE